MKKRIFVLVLTLILLTPFLSLTAHADCGPKPSTYITVHTGGGERAVVTLLGDLDQYGPNNRVEPGAEPPEYQVHNDIEREAWYVFRDYVDPDGFLFWGEVWDSNVNWNYWPPETFKIAVYYPDYDVLWVSDETFDRYAFHSDYRLNLPALGEGAVSAEVDMVLRKDSDIPEEVFRLVLRIVVTLAIELAVAWLFGFDSRRQRKLLFRVNLVTQVILNVVLWSYYYWEGPLAAMLVLVLAELIVLAVELVCYMRWLREDESAWRVVGYTFAANLTSVVLGFVMLS